MYKQIDTLEQLKKTRQEFVNASNKYDEASKELKKARNDFVLARREFYNETEDLIMK